MASSSLTISFNTITDTEDQFIDLELNSEKNVNAAGDEITTFEFGSVVYLREFTNCSNTDYYPSEGSVSNDSPTSGTLSVTEQITFDEPPASAGGLAEDNTASLSYPCTGNFSYTLLGGSGAGSLSIDPVDLKQVNASLAGPAVYTVSYTANFNAKKITGPSAPADWDSDETYPVVVVVVGS